MDTLQKAIQCGIRSDRAKQLVDEFEKRNLHRPTNIIKQGSKYYKAIRTDDPEELLYEFSTEVPKSDIKHLGRNPRVNIVDADLGFRIRQCRHCGNKFPAEQNHQMYCFLCQDRKRRKRLLKDGKGKWKPGILRKCERCKKPISHKKIGARFCSEACRKAMSRKERKKVISSVNRPGAPDTEGFS